MRGDGARQQAVGAGLLGFIQRRDRALHGARKHRAVQDPGALFVERGELTADQRQRIEFLHLMAQQIEARMAVTGGRLDFEGLAHQRQPPGVGAPDLGGQGLEPTKTVDQLPLRCGADQGLEFMLAMDVDQQLTGIAQHLHRHCLPVEPGAAATIIADHPTDAQFRILADRVLLEQATQRAPLFTDLHDGTDVGALGAGADDVGAAAATGQDLKGIDQHRLASPGLAGQHGHARCEIEFDRLDNCKVSDLELTQHNASALVSFLAAAPMEL
jgi:hypothetical protein